MTNKKKDRQYNGQQKEGQAIQWPTKKRTGNTMANKKKDRQYNGQQKRTSNAMANKKKDRQYNDQQKEGQAIQ
jgi:hypothetical protein